MNPFENTETKSLSFMTESQIEIYYKLALSALENKDDKKFLKYITIACKNNHVEALLQLGFYYRDNVINPEKMIECWIKASSLGNSDASYNLGREYWRRNDYVLMIKYYDECCHNGDYDAAYQLACYYRDIDNKKLMTHYINMGVSHNNKLCKDLCDSLKLDHIYYRKGVENDKKGNIDNAIKYYKQSIDTGNTTIHTKSSIASMFNLGLLYEKNDNNTLAIKYYSMACDNGSLEAPFNLGSYYDNIKDYINMKKYYLIGIERDCNKCLNQMIKYSSLTKDEDNIIKYTKISADRGDKQSIYFMKNLDYSLGILYEYLGDIDNMKRCYDNGIKNKCIKCCKAMIDYMRQIKDIDNIIKYDDILAKLEDKKISPTRKEFNEAFTPPDEAKESGWTAYKDMKFCVQLDFIKNKFEKIVNHSIKHINDELMLRMTAVNIMSNITEQQSCIIFKNKDYIVGSRVIFRKKGTKGIYTSFNSRHIAELILNKNNKKGYMVNFYSDDWEQALVKPPICVIFSMDNILNCMNSTDLKTFEKMKIDYDSITTTQEKINICDSDFFTHCIHNLSYSIIKCNYDTFFIIYHNKIESHKQEQIKKIIGDKDYEICDSI